MGQSEETECGSVTVTVPEQTAILENLRVMQVQIDELKHNMDREVSRRVKNTFESNTELKLEVRNLRAELTDQRVSNKVVTAERDKIHSELVNVRSALAAATAERDNLRITLDAWEQADTKPHKRVAADDVADHVVPPILHVGEPDPANDAKDAKLEFRNVVPTPEMIAACTWWDLVGAEKAICLKHNTLRTVAWRAAGDYDQDRWKYTDCPQPLKPHGMTWQQLDAVLASKKAAESPADPVSASDVSLCDKCHGCGHTLSRIRTHAECLNEECDLDSTYGASDISPYYGPCRSTQQVRHE